MAALVRQHHLLLVSWLFLALASPSSASPLLQPRYLHDYPLLKRHDITTLDNGTQVVLDPDTGLPITQGSASDGSGVGFTPPAIIWLAWSFAVGVPLALAGIRLWRATTGASLGVACAVCVWAAFVNTMNADGISDLLLTVMVMGAFTIGFSLGVFQMARTAALFALGVLGGFSIGVRIVLFRSGLLIPSYVMNWIVILVFGLLGFFLVVARQRVGITVCSAAVGTFLIGLGIDLLVSQQDGMSIGLRYLFDRNSAHVLELQGQGWHTPSRAIIIMAVSLALIPLLAYMQHRLFSGPFKRVRRSDSLASLPADTNEKEANPSNKLLKPDHESSPEASLIGSTEKLLHSNGTPRTPDTPRTA